MKLNATSSFSLQPAATTPPAFDRSPVPAGSGAAAHLAAPADAALPTSAIAPRGVERLDRQALARSFEINRALTRGRIEGLQTALRILSQPSGGPADAHELQELREARVKLYDRLQAHYAQFLGNTQATPAGMPRAARGQWKRQEVGRLLQEDLGWARCLNGDTQDLVHAIERLIHKPL